MCGLIGVISRESKEEVVESVLEQYERQHSRGTRGFGLIEVNKTSFRTRRATEPTKALLDITRSDSNILLFHHRQPTSTNNTLEQTHPIYVSNKELKFDYSVMHNGVIYNAEERKKAHEALGYIYTTYDERVVSSSYHSKQFNDSESLAIDVARVIEGLDEKIKSKGAAAFFILQIDKKTGHPVRIFWGRNERNPLIIQFYKSQISIASELDIGDEVEQGKLFSVKVADIYGTKKQPRKLVSERPIEWEETEIVKALPTATTSKTYNWNEHNTQSHRHVGFVPPQKQNATTEDAGPDDEETPPTLREAAFETMWDRDMTTINQELYPLYEELMYDNVPEEGVDALVAIVKEVLMKRVTSSIKAKDWFDKAEDQEAARNKEEDEWNETLIKAQTTLLEDDAPSTTAVIPLGAAPANLPIGDTRRMHGAMTHFNDPSEQDYDPHPRLGRHPQD